MRILHTSDWHIGRTFHGVDLRADQDAVLAEIARIVAAEGVDVVVVSGDLYDRAMPNADAVRLCNDAFVRIRDAGARIIATSGNHDSATRVGAAAEFAAAGGLHLRTRVPEIDVPVLIEDEHGPVAFYAIPYLEPDVVRGELAVAERSHEAVLAAAMARINADREAREASAGADRLRTVVSAHAFVTGAVPSESERTISVGGVETVPMSVFGDVDYVALGHLHTPQVLARSVRYSGSPVPYSFGERSDRKAVWLVDLDANGLRDVTEVALPLARPLGEMTGTVAQLLSEPALEELTSHYLSAVLTDPVRPRDPMRVLRERFPHLVHLRWESPARDKETSYRQRVSGASDKEIARRFLIDTWREPTAADLDLVEEALQQARAGSP
ncbi:exonuclease SbcCD subunit D [Hoyosella sp. G463]|uniref:Nuclease SbcCD subunit D n=1 Tax=Lolliginicoccus lacisalsi TaxID=2742202 RepID=A0A927JBR9_9ACTN|nr:exonuclease SbcCD subunit D [Lolliginicoccus lacisalsi]MBD8506245.1 exonuclease SbcCD subunit D [Lolliginicoccus lacisalsi]